MNNLQLQRVACALAITKQNKTCDKNTMPSAERTMLIILSSYIKSVSLSLRFMTSKLAIVRNLCSLQTSKRFFTNNTKLKSQVLQNHKYMLHETHMKEGFSSVHGRFLL